MAENKAKKSPQPDADDTVAKQDDKLVIKDSTIPNQEEPETSKDELEGKDLGDSSQHDTQVPADDTPKPVEEAPHSEAATTSPSPKKRFVWTRKKIILAVVAALILVIGILAAIPTTRYAIAGLVVKRDVTFTLHDSKTNKPVSNVVIEAGGQNVITDAKGMATFKSMPVGVKTFEVQKKNYKGFSSTQTVGIFGNNPTFDLSIEATGRQVPVSVINKVSKKPVEGATIVADGTSSKTDKNGEAILVLPANKETVDADVNSPGYNPTKASIVVTEQKDDKNTFSLTPSGKLYFLSDRDGTLDVYKSDLDGSNAEVVLKGTGRESGRETALLASRDWKYLALKAKRDSDKAKLYLIETATGKLSVIDEGDDVDFTLAGWSNTHFVYQVSRNKVKQWEPKGQAIKSFNATSGTLTTLDETAGEGDNITKFAHEQYTSIYLLKNEVFYTKSWYQGELGMLAKKVITVNSVRPDGSDKKVVKDFPADGSNFDISQLYKPQEVYVRVYLKGSLTVWEYDDGKFNQTDKSADEILKPYPTYLLSPSGQNTFWTEQRDGKNALFIGDSEGNSPKQIATLSEYTAYGWFTDDYLLLSKNGSEIYILARNNPGAEPIKVTDYHKLQTYIYGYGGGYGGL